MKKLLLIIMIAGLSGCLSMDLSDADRYQEEIQKIQNRDEAADFTNLRMVYTNTSLYEPFGGKEKLLLDTMFRALQKNDYKVCIDQAEEILESNYASLNAHYAAMNCQYQMGDRETSAYHRYVLDGLVSSISESGDGVSKESAFVVISQLEMKAFLDLKGMQIRKRKLDRDKRRGRAYNVMSVSDSEGQRRKVIFDVTIQMSKGL